MFRKKTATKTVQYTPNIHSSSGSIANQQQRKYHGYQQHHPPHTSCTTRPTSRGNTEGPSNRQRTHESYSPMSFSSSLRLLSSVSRSSPYAALPAPRSSPSRSRSVATLPVTDGGARTSDVKGGDGGGGDCGCGGGDADRRRCSGLDCPRRLPPSAGRFRFFCRFRPSSPLVPGAAPASLLAGPVGTISCIIFSLSRPWKAESVSVLHPVIGERNSSSS